MKYVQTDEILKYSRFPILCYNWKTQEEVLVMTSASLPQGVELTVLKLRYTGPFPRLPVTKEEV